MPGVVLGVAPSLAVLSLLAFAVSLVAFCKSEQGQGPEHDRDQRGLQPSLRKYGDSKSAGICMQCKPEPGRRAASLRWWTRNVREPDPRGLLCTASL